jgi:regulator of sigma E protease
MELLQTILITLGTLAVLVTVHEYGHFWVARRCGIKVLRFSIGFGTALYRWRDKTGTEFVIAAIPLGGYVKMLDEREGNVAEKDLPYAFNRQPVLSRLATVAAGPLANFALAIVVYWMVFAGGVSGVSPVIDSVEAGSIAAQANLEPGQEIVAVDGEDTPTWEALHMRLLQRIGESGEIDFTVKYPNSDMMYHSTAVLSDWLAGSEATDLIAGLGLELYRPEHRVVIYQTIEDSPAAAAGLMAGDYIVSTDGNAVTDYSDWIAYVAARPEQHIDLGYERDGQIAYVDLIPASKINDDGDRVGQIGVQINAEWQPWPEEMKRSFSYGVFGSALQAVERTWSMSVFTLESIKKMLMGLISPKNLSGPITIAKVASASAKSGLESYLSFLALLSISLGVLNLLPIPVLDGGHILYNIAELLTGKEVPEKVQVIGYQLGLFIIVSVMILAMYNDISRL